MIHELDSRPIDHRKLLRLRQERGWSQRKVAEAANMEARQYARYERGEVEYHPGRLDTYSNLRAIAALYALAPEDLILGDVPRAPARVERPEERLLLRRLLLPGKPIPLQGPWRFGKATLLGQVLRAFRAAAAEPVQVLRADLHALAEDLKSFNGFLYALGRCISAAHEPPLRPELFEEAWQGPESAASKLGWFLHDHVLKERVTAVLVLEHVERLQETAFHDALFAMLRGWAESAVKEPGSHWPRLRILVTVATEPELLETVGDHSGFFAAAAPMIRLGPFTAEQCAALAAVHGHAHDAPGLSALHQLVEGQPYLTDLALAEARLREVPLRELLADGDFRGGIFEQHLGWLHQWLLRRELTALVPALLRGERIARRDYCQAYSMGLLKETRHNEYQFQCNLYRKYFEGRCN